MNDTERLEWYVRHVAETDEPLGRHMRPDKVMGITALGQVTEHEVWYWPMDRANEEFPSFREAIDERMRVERRIS